MNNLKASLPALNQRSGLIWQYIPESSAIKQWALELQQLASSPFDPVTWSLAGHAVVIMSDDHELTEDLLRSTAKATGMNFLSVPADEILNFPSVLEGVPTDLPSLVYLEPGLWLGNCLEGDKEILGFERPPLHDEIRAFAFRKELKRILLNIVPTTPVIVATSLNSIDFMDVQLRCNDCFDRRIQVPRMADDILVRVFMDEMGSSNLDHTITSNPKRLGALLADVYPDLRRRQLMEKAVLRLCWREDRQVTLNDLITFCTYGTLEEDKPPVSHENRKSHAVHEAGHALIAYLSSRKKTPPAYCAIKARNGQYGVVVTAYEDVENEANEWTYSDAINQIRIGLGGRAAEHLVFGTQNASLHGSSADMMRATQFAFRIFGRLGFPLDTDSDEAAASNLAVISGSPTPTEYEHVERAVRIFLQRQFLAVLDMLRQHLPLLNAITDALIEKQVLFQEDFVELLKSTEAN